MIVPQENGGKFLIFSTSPGSVPATATGQRNFMVKMFVKQQLCSTQ
jgi:hypothetical protein